MKEISYNFCRRSQQLLYNMYYRRNFAWATPEKEWQATKVATESNRSCCQFSAREPFFCKCPSFLLLILSLTFSMSIANNSIRSKLPEDSDTEISSSFVAYVMIEHHCSQKHSSWTKAINKSSFALLEWLWPWKHQGTKSSLNICRKSFIFNSTSPSSVVWPLYENIVTGPNISTKTDKSLTTSGESCN